jgi:hypothetical protein
MGEGAAGAAGAAGASECVDVKTRRKQLQMRLLRRVLDTLEQVTNVSQTHYVSATKSAFLHQLRATSIQWHWSRWRQRRWSRMQWLFGQKKKTSSTSSTPSILDPHFTKGKSGGGGSGNEELDPMVRAVLQQQHATDVESPYVSWLHQVLGYPDRGLQSWWIVAFVSQHCRPWSCTSASAAAYSESPHWLYCRTTGTPLLPMTVYALAAAWLQGEQVYANECARIQSQQAVLCWNQQWWCDKHTGYALFRRDVHSECNAILPHPVVVSGKKDVDPTAAAAAATAPVEKDDVSLQSELGPGSLLSVFSYQSSPVYAPMVAIVHALGVEAAMSFDAYLETVLELTQATMLVKVKQSKTEYEASLSTSSKTKALKYSLYYDQQRQMWTSVFFMFALLQSIPSFRPHSTTSTPCWSATQSATLDQKEDVVQYVCCLLQRINATHRNKLDSPVWGTCPSKDNAVDQYVHLFTKYMDSILAHTAGPPDTHLLDPTTTPMLPIYVRIHQLAAAKQQWLSTTAATSTRTTTTSVSTVTLPSTTHSLTAPLSPFPFKTGVPAQLCSDMLAHIRSSLASQETDVYALSSYSCQLGFMYESRFRSMASTDAHQQQQRQQECVEMVRTAQGLSVYSRFMDVLTHPHSRRITLTESTTSTPTPTDAAATVPRTLLQGGRLSERLCYRIVLQAAHFAPADVRPIPWYLQPIVGKEKPNPKRFQGSASLDDIIASLRKAPNDMFVFDTARTQRVLMAMSRRHILATQLRPLTVALPSPLQSECRRIHHRMSSFVVDSTTPTTTPTTTTEEGQDKTHEEPFDCNRVLKQWTTHWLRCSDKDAEVRAKAVPEYLAWLRDTIRTCRRVVQTCFQEYPAKYAVWSQYTKWWVHKNKVGSSSSVFFHRQLRECVHKWTHLYPSREWSRSQQSSFSATKVTGLQPMLFRMVQLTMPRLVPLDPCVEALRDVYLLSQQLPLSSLSLATSMPGLSSVTEHNTEPDAKTELSTERSTELKTEPESDTHTEWEPDTTTESTLQNEQTLSLSFSLQLWFVCATQVQLLHRLDQHDNQDPHLTDEQRSVLQILREESWQDMVCAWAQEGHLQYTRIARCFTHAQ